MKAGKRHEATGNSMRVKVFGFALCALLLALCGQVSAQQPKKVHRIGVLLSGSRTPISEGPFREAPPRAWLH